MAPTTPENVLSLVRKLKKDVNLEQTNELLWIAYNSTGNKLLLEYLDSTNIKAKLYYLESILLESIQNNKNKRAAFIDILSKRYSIPVTITGQLPENLEVYKVMDRLTLNIYLPYKDKVPSNVFLNASLFKKVGDKAQVKDIGFDATTVGLMKEGFIVNYNGEFGTVAVARRKVKHENVKIQFTNTPSLPSEDLTVVQKLTNLEIEVE